MRDAEFQLAVAACGVGVDDRPLDVPLDNIRWDRFLATANRHRVQALCWEALKPSTAAIPRQVSGSLQAQAREIVVTNLAAAAESMRLCDLFHAAGLPVLFIKGLTLAALAYRNPLLKMSLDIDLLIGPERLDEASHLLRSAGYAAVFPRRANQPQLARWHADRKESIWCRDDGNFQVDLHTRLADHPAMLAGLNAASRSQPVTVVPGITLPTLADEELFAYLCVHGASSAWFRLKWITDLSAILRGRRPGEIERLYDRSQEYGSGRAAGQALLLAECIYSIGIGAKLRNRLSQDPANRWLTRLAERQLRNPAEPTERMLGTATIHLSQLGLLPGWRFKVSEAERQFRDLFRSFSG